MQSSRWIIIKPFSSEIAKLLNTRITLLITFSIEWNWFIVESSAISASWLIESLLSSLSGFNIYTIFIINYLTRQTKYLQENQVEYMNEEVLLMFVMNENLS